MRNVYKEVLRTPLASSCEKHETNEACEWRSKNSKQNSNRNHTSND